MCIRDSTEGTVDLMRIAGLKEAGLCCEIMREDGEMMRTKELIEFAQDVYKRQVRSNRETCGQHAACETLKGTSTGERFLSCLLYTSVPDTRGGSLESYFLEKSEVDEDEIERLFDGEVPGIFEKEKR